MVSALSRRGIVHVLFHPVAAKRFAEPLVQALIADGFEAELWVQRVPGTDPFLGSLTVPVRMYASNISLNPLETAAAFIALWSQLRRRRPRIVAAHFSRGAFLPLLAALISRVPVRIYHNHGVPYLGYRGLLRWALQCLERVNCYLATHIVTVSAGMQPILQKLAPANRRVTMFGPGSACGLAPFEYHEPDMQAKTEARRAWNIGDGELVFLYVGRPHRRKGFHLMLEVFQRLFGARPDVKLLMCGCSPADVVAVLPSAPPGIRALGYREDLRGVYQAADAVLLPSLHEGFGNSLLEGAAQGCALLASNIPGPDSLVEDGKNGFLTVPGSAEDLARVLRLMDRDRPRLQALGVAAYQKAQQFRRELVIAPYIAFMRGLCAADSGFAEEKSGGRLAA